MLRALSVGEEVGVFALALFWACFGLGQRVYWVLHGDVLLLCTVCILGAHLVVLPACSKIAARAGGACVACAAPCVYGHTHLQV